MIVSEGSTRRNKFIHCARTVCRGLQKREQSFVKDSPLTLSSIAGVISPVVCSAAVGTPLLVTLSALGATLAGLFTSLCCQEAIIKQLDNKHRKGKKSFSLAFSLKSFGSGASWASLNTTAMAFIASSMLTPNPVVLNEHLGSLVFEKTPSLAQQYCVNALDANGAPLMYRFRVDDARKIFRPITSHTILDEVDIGGIVERPSLFIRGKRTEQKIKGTLTKPVVPMG